MIKRNQRLLNAFNLISDVVLILLSYMAALWLRFDVLGGRKSIQLASPTVISAVMGYCLLITLVYYVLGLYGYDRLRRKREESLRIVLVNAVGTLSFMAVCYLLRVVDFSRMMLALFWCISSFAVVFKRMFIRAVLSYYRRRGYNLKHVIIVGSGQLAYQYARDIQENAQLGYKMMGYIGDVCQSALGKHLGTYARIGEILDKKNPDEVVIAMDPQDIQFMPEIMAAVDKEGVRLSLIPFFNDYIPRILRLRRWAAAS